MAQIFDDKSEHCIPFILDHVQQHRRLHTSRGETPSPFFVGLNGVQGAGKTTLVGVKAPVQSIGDESLKSVLRVPCIGKPRE